MLGALRRRWIEVLLVVGGLVELGMALLHFLMPSTVLTRPEFTELEPAARDFVVLSVVCIGLLLLAMAAVSFLAATIVPSAPAVAGALAGLEAAGWAGRFCLELAWPVREPILFLSQPSLAILLAAALVVCCYGVAARASWRRRGGDDNAET